MVNCYTSEEVKSHNKSSDCWVIYKEKVYDVTSFLEDHPGGQEIILEHAGMDCTVAFEDVGHSSSAYDMLKDFCIGDLVKSHTVNTARSCCDHETSAKNSPLKSSPCQTNNWPIIGAAIIIGGAIAYNAFFKK